MRIQAALILSLAVVSALTGCTVDRVVRDNVLPECPGRNDKASARAADCMGAAMYEMGQKKKDEGR